MPISLDHFDVEVMPALVNYATIPCLSPAFDAQWSENGHLEQAMSLYAEWARARHFAHHSVTVHRIEGRTPVLVVTVEATAPTSGTVLLYGHLDKQPPLGEWSEGLDPYTPVRRGNRLYARGVADDGYAMFASLLAIEELERRGTPHARCVVLIEASEESGSPDLEAHLDALTPHLGNVELMICLDSGALTYDRLWVTTSLRGVVVANLTVRVLDRGQHSGSASGVVPSSMRIIRQLLDRIEDARTGDILLPELIAAIPASHVAAADAVAQEFGDVAANEQPFATGVTPMGESAAERILRRTWYPTLSYVGADGLPPTSIAGNVLRDATTLALSFRLPPSVDPTVACAAIERALTTDVPHNAQVTVEIDGAAGWVSPELAPWLRAALDEASTLAFGTSVAFAGEGGSIPFLASLGKRFDDVQFVATGVLGPHSNAHGIDEMLDLECAVAVTNAMSHVIAAHAARKDNP
ncbi:MAG: M20/M25/M40 family metallo-hydrolase [Acidobacteria bacterium]|nr:M20/M25/M40 family metallo-hydrolase [Acidobacteriota bacterium]